MNSVAADIRRVVEAAMVNAPRSLQKTIGPSELGMTCIRCLTHKLAGTEPRREAAWLPFIGTAVHEKLESIFEAQEATRADLGLPRRYYSEQRVTVGSINGIPVTGSTDLFDTATGTVVDFKIVGTTTLRKVKAAGASAQYRTQASLYGLGWQAAGHDVHQVLVYFLPRNSVTLADGIAWSAPFDPAPGRAALARATTILQLIAAAGLDVALDAAGPHTDDGFTCRGFPDWQPPTQAPGGDPFAG